MPLPTGGLLFSQHPTPFGDLCGGRTLVTLTRTHGVIFHPLHQSLDLACKIPTKERRWVLFRKSVWVPPPPGPVLEVPRAGAPLCALAETLQLRDRSALPVLESEDNKEPFEKPTECLS